MPLPSEVDIGLFILSNHIKKVKVYTNTLKGQERIQHYQLILAELEFAQSTLREFSRAMKSVGYRTDSIRKRASHATRITKKESADHRGKMK